MSQFINERGEAAQRTEGRTTIKGSEVAVPVDVQGVQVAEGEKLPVEIVNRHTEYLKDQVIPAGSSTFFNHKVTGRSLGVAIRFNSSTDFTVQMGYVVPDSLNYIMIPYEELVSGTANDSGGTRVEAKNSDARFKISNNGTEDVTVMSLSVVDF